MCAAQLSAPQAESGSHFRNVCRAMVSEALELSSFMEKVAHYDEEEDEELRALCLQDWVRVRVRVSTTVLYKSCKGRTKNISEAGKPQNH